MNTIILKCLQNFETDLPYDDINTKMKQYISKNYNPTLVFLAFGKCLYHIFYTAALYFKEFSTKGLFYHNYTNIFSNLNIAAEQKDGVTTIVRYLACSPHNLNLVLGITDVLLASRLEITRKMNNTRGHHQSTICHRRHKKCIWLTVQEFHHNVIKTS